MSIVLKLDNVSKFYPGVVALNKVSMSFEEGKVHGLMGENGAGKSTLIKCITGAIRTDEGTITIAGEEHTRLTPAASKAAGVSAIYQELNLVPSMSVAENIFLGEKPGGKLLPDFEEMHRRSAKIFADFGIDVDTHTMVGDLSVAQQQIVEIAKAISANVKVLIMDEPSSMLATAEVEIMFDIVRRLKSQGVTIIYISHRLDEVFSICDTVTILRDGMYICSDDIHNVTRRGLITNMVGREVDETYPKQKTLPGETVLESFQLTGNGDRNISFRLRKGEILGVAGLVGSGRTEMIKMIYGAAKIEKGYFIVKNRKITALSPSKAIKEGIGLIPEDRKKEGAFLDFSIGWNIPIMSIKNYSKFGVVDRKKEQAVSRKYFEKLQIKAPDMDVKVKNLSGGNQQKVVVAKALAAVTDILIFDEPTRGIDVGAKQEIYHLMNSLTKEGKSIIMISSDMEELLGMSDRIIVMYEGELMGEVKKEEFSQDKIMMLASGMKEEL